MAVLTLDRSYTLVDISYIPVNHSYTHVDVFYTRGREWPYWLVIIIISDLANSPVHST